MKKIILLLFLIPIIGFSQTKDYFPSIETDSMDIWYYLNMKNGNILNLGSFYLDTTFQKPETQVKGQVYWNTSDKAITLVLGDGEVNLSQNLVINYINKDIVPLIKGDVVSFEYSNGFLGISRTDITNKTSALSVLGIVDSPEILVGDSGRVVKFGNIKNIPYTFPSMTQLYVDTIKGKLTNSPPTFEKYKIIIGEYVNTNEINVNPKVYPSINDLSGLFGSPTKSGQILLWNNDSSYFTLDYNLLDTIQKIEDSIAVFTELIRDYTTNINSDLNKDSLRNEIDTLSISVYDSLYNHLNQIQQLKNNYQQDSDTLTWDATKKDLKDSTAYLKTLIEQAEARFPDFANSLQSTTGTQDTLIMTPLRVYEMIQMLSVQPYGEEEDLYLKGRKIISDSLIVDGIRAENRQVELLGNLQVSDTLKVERIQLIDGYTEGYYLKIGANGNVEVSAISGAMVYKGTWDASTNTPTLANGTGTNGWYYRVVVGGTKNLGSGNITFSAGDDILYDGLVWQRVPSPTYSLQAATISTLGGVKIGSNINVTEDGTISTHAQQNIYTNGLPGIISILNGSTLALNVNDADASTTNEIQAISILNDVISITRDASTVDLGYLQDSISSVRGYVNTVKGVILNEINLGMDSIRLEVDTLKTSLYDSIYSHKLRLEDLEALDVVEFSDLSGIRDSVSNNKDSIVTHNTRLLALESLDIIEGSDLSWIRDSISVNLDSIQAHNLRLLVVEGLDTMGIYHFNRGFLDQITSKAQLVSDTLVWDATKNDLKVMVRDSISGLRSELTAYFNLKLSDSTAYLRAMVSDSTLFLRGEISSLELEIKDSILNHRTEIDSLKNVTSSLTVPEKATTLETVTSTESEDYVTPKTLKEFLELSYVPYYGSNEDLYTKKVTADSLILRDLTGEGIRAVAVDAKGKLIDTLLVFDDISELTLWNKGQSDSIKGLLYWNQIQSDSLKIIADSLAFYVVTVDDSIQAHRVELQALKDSIFDHRTELEIIKDTLVDHNLRLIPLERLDTTGIHHDNRNYLDLLADQAQERRDTLTFDATKYDLRKMVGDSTFYLKEMIGDSTEYLKTLIDSVNTKNYIEVDSIKIKDQVAHGIITGGEQTPYLISKAYMDSVLTLIVDERTISYADTTGNFLVVSERPALIKYLILDGIGTVKIGRTLDGSDILIDRVVDQKVKIVLTKYFEETLYWTTTGTISFKMWYKYTDENIGSGYDSGYWEGY